MTPLAVIPAIDLAGGQAVRLLRGERGACRIVAPDPEALARRFAAEGAESLHVVDLDAAFGSGDNRDLIERIIAALGVPVQVGGGVRRIEDARRWRAAGAARVVIGTLAVREPDAVRRLAEDDPEGVVVAADSRHGRVAVSGWTVDSGAELGAFVARLRSSGIRRVLVTAVERDGTGDGPDEAVLRTALGAFGPGVIASGGVGRAEHVRRLARMAAEGLSGVVVGSLLVDGGATLAELTAAARGD